MIVWSTHLGCRVQSQPARAHVSVTFSQKNRRARGWRAAQPRSPLPAGGWRGKTRQTPVAFMRKPSSCPPSTIFRAISWHTNLYFWAFCHSDKKKGGDEKNWFGSSAEPKQQTWNVAFPNEAFLCQTSLLLQKQRAMVVALKNAFCLPHSNE